MRDLLGRLRRMAVTLTNSAIWQVAGHVLLDKTRETRKAEVFSGIGVYARPPSTGGTPEAVVVFPGGPAHALIAATRDETTRRALFKVAGDLAPDETAIFTSKALVVIKADGTVEIRSAAGVAAPLATKADVDAIRNALNGHSHTYLPGTGAAALTTLNPAVPAPVGTTKLKAE